MASLKAVGIGGGNMPEGFEAPEGLEAVAVFDSFSNASDSGLAILAMGNAYWTILHAGRYVICVDALKVGVVRHELLEFAALARSRKPAGRLEYHEFDFGGLSFLLYAAVLIACFIWQQNTAGIVSVGRGDALAMVDGGEWWRAVTALTLHADIAHLVSNLVAGMGFAFFACRFFGAASGWLLILLSGMMGNALNAVVYYPEAHASIGASTAVFGTLGLLTGVGVWAAFSAPELRLMLPRWLVPVFGGLTLLGLFGMGEGGVDVAAHISGFICGVLLGVGGACLQGITKRLYRWRVLLGVLSLLLIVGAWVWAFMVGK
jgi:rhomboid protease GluP